MPSSKKTSTDINGVVEGLLRDLAAVQTSAQSRWGYKRAAAAVRGLPQPIDRYIQSNGTLRKIPNIGPSSTKVIMEVLRGGISPTVEQALASCTRKPEVDRSRGLRDNFLSRAQVEAALKNRRLKGVSLRDYRGDLQMHSVWSDGTQTLESIVEAGLDRGYQFSAVTDHSYGLPIANGVSMADLARQHQEIDALNKRYKGRFRLLKGIEANILADGSIDMQDDELRAIEIVVAAPHSALRSSVPQTARLLKAVTRRSVHILGHPRGRKYGTRPGVAADWDVIFAAAARSGVAIEIDGDPSRQDLDYDLARQAAAAGCLFALDSDAHSNEELQYAETAIAHARLAGIPAERVINCWPVERLLDWARQRSAA